MADDKKKTNVEKLEAALYIQWAKRERFMIVCRRLGFCNDDLLLISKQYYSFKSN